MARHRPDQPGAGDQRQIQRRQQPRLRLADRRDGVDHPGCAGHPGAQVVVVGVGHLELAAHGRRALDLDAVETAAGCRAVAEVARGYRDVRLRPVGRKVVAHAGDVVDDESWLAVNVSGQRGPHRTDRSGGNVPGGRVERLLGDHPLDALVQVVDLDAQPRGELIHHRPPAEGEHPRRRGECGELRRLAESQYLVDGVFIRVGRIVEHLGHPHRLDDPRYSGKHKRQNIVGESGVDPGGEERCAAGGRRLAQRRGEPCVNAVGVHQRHHRARHHVLARAQDRHHVVDRLSRPQVGPRRIDHYVGVTGQQLRGILCCRHTDGVRPAQLPRITTRLGIAVNDEIDELQLRVVDHSSQGDQPHRARTPDADLVHRFS